MNIVLVVLDSQRRDHIGAYGNPWIRTPHLDALVRESVSFTRAYPESLPTLPVRRALHTATRTFPFRSPAHFKGDIGSGAGWGPMEESKDTVSEVLQRNGFRTAFISDTYHQFKPSKNFHRGFDEWTWIRGQETDCYKSGPPVSREQIAAHMAESPQENPRLAAFLTKYLRNNSYRLNEGDYFPAKLFTEASRWLWDNHDAEQFFLVVDSFDPHEPWDPPVYYRRMYDPDDDVQDVIQTLYAPWRGRLTPRQMKRIQANYAGEVTMVDRWFGFFMETLRNSGRLEDTVVAVISDHGHSLGHDPADKGLLSKQGYPMTRAVADLVMTIRHPSGEGAGASCDALVYNLDLTTTLMRLAGVQPTPEMEGLDLWPLVRQGGRGRDYVSIGWLATVSVIDNQWWYNASVWGDEPLLFDLTKDPNLLRDVASQHPDVCRMMHARVVADAGGEIPVEMEEYRERFQHQLNCTPYVNEVLAAVRE